MPLRKSLLFILFPATIAISCNSGQVNSKKDSVVNKTDTPGIYHTKENEAFFLKFKEVFPYTDLKLIAYSSELSKYVNVIYPETSDCSSFDFHRLLLGNISNIIV
jgi:hypothetical protein